MYVVGLDIGGTKCALSLGEIKDGEILLLDRFEVKTKKNWQEIIDELLDQGEDILRKKSLSYSDVEIGISCGGPLSAERGVIISPPNLPGWENAAIVDYIYKKIGVRASLQNDADACALAEWKFGAGKGARNMIFLTFGTGMGAGLILNERLYVGSDNMAGEVGHIRLESDGPLGHNKAGSFEGFCSGGGIAKQGQIYALKERHKGKRASFDLGDLEEIDAKLIAEKAKEGHEDAKLIYYETGKKLGYGLSILVDILNPDTIVIGSIYRRSSELLLKGLEEVLKEEALENSLTNLQIKASYLGENIGDYAAMVTALK